MTADGDVDRYQPEAPGRVAAPRAAVRSDDLFRGTHEIVIVHRDEQYRLRITRADKLILTK